MSARPFYADGGGMAETPHLLIVDDEHFIRTALQIYFESHAFQVTTAGDGESALAVFQNEHDTIDAVVLDLVMPGTHGLDVLARFKATDPGVEVIIATGCASLGSAVEALRLGAFDYITKPILDFDADLMSSVQAAIDARRRTREILRRAAENESSPVAVAVNHWAEVFPRLNAFAVAHAEESPPDRLLEKIGEVLRDCFLVDGALFLDRTPDGGWIPLYTWEHLSGAGENPSWVRTALRVLGRLTADSKRFDLFVAVDPTLAEERPFATDVDGLTDGPLVVPLPLPIVSGTRRRWLALYYAKAPELLRGRSPSVPLALLGSIVGPLLERSLAEPVASL